MNKENKSPEGTGIMACDSINSKIVNPVQTGISFPKKYVPPVILKETTINVSYDLLSSSVVTNNIEVETMGHEVVDYDFSSHDWNSNWE